MSFGAFLTISNVFSTCNKKRCFLVTRIMNISNHRFYVGTSRGILLCTGDKPTDINVWKNDHSSEVTAVSNGRKDDEIILGYDNGQVNMFNTTSTTFSSLPDLEGEERVTGVGSVGSQIVVAKRDGVINVCKKKKNDFFTVALDEKGSLDSMACHPNRDGIIGIGGEFNDFKLWDVQTSQCTFKAKSLGHDELQLPIPTSVRGICFFPDEPQIAACCTKEGHVLLYDERAQRRPVVKFLEKQASYTCISCGYRNREIMAGTTRGYLQRIDLKANKVIKTFQNFTGSVTDIYCDPIEPYVASVSLDRYLRVHNIDNKELVLKCYMKQNLTALIVKPIVKNEEEKEGAKEDSEKPVDEEYEDLFNNMEEVQSDKKLKRKSTSEAKKRKKIKSK